jgi:hypothetical protein
MDITDPYNFALNSLTSNQKHETLVERLPFSIRESIKKEEQANPDASAYSSAIIDLCLESYERSIDDISLSGFIAKYLFRVKRDNDFFNESIILSQVTTKLAQISLDKIEDAAQIDKALSGQVAC